MTTQREWSHWFDCIDDQDKPVTNIVQEAVEIRINKWDVCFGIEHLEKWKEMGRVISRCKRLKRIIISKSKLNMTVLMAIFQSDGPYKFPLEFLDFENAKMSNPGLRALLPFLKSRKTLKMLNLEDNSLDAEATEMIAEILDEIRVEELNVSHNRLTALGINRLLSSKNSRHLISLNVFLSYSRQERFKLAKFFGDFLVIEGISLKKLVIGTINMGIPYLFDFDSEITLIQSLKTNTTVENLEFLYLPSFGQSSHRFPELYNQLNDAVTSLVCNTSSFEELCNSNHTLQNVRLISVLRRLGEMEAAKASLEANAWPDLSSNQTLRYKLKSIYFRGAFDVRPFLDMKAVWVPHVLEFLSSLPKGNDDNGARASPQDLSTSCQGRNLNRVYHFIRFWNVPQLFAFPPAKNKFHIEILTRRVIEAISRLGKNEIQLFKPRRNIKSS